MSALRLAFMGTPDFAVASLSALIAAGHQIVAVYSQPPRRAGRGHHAVKSPVHGFAETHGLGVRAPVNFKEEVTREDFAALDLDAAVVVAYGLILPPAILGGPRLGCLNAHASLLPRWRGAAPIERAIMAGDSRSGVTVMRLDEGLDTGPVLLEREFPIPPDMTGGGLREALAPLAATALLEGLDGLATGRLTACPQDSSGVTYADKIDKREARIDWARPAVEIERLIRGLNPAPGAFFVHRDNRVKVLASALEPGRAGAALGEVLDDQLLVACGAGALRLTEVKRQGKAVMSAADMLRGFPITTGARLG